MKPQYSNRMGKLPARPSNLMRQSDHQTWKYLKWLRRKYLRFPSDRDCWPLLYLRKCQISSVSAFCRQIKQSRINFRIKTIKVPVSFVENFRKSLCNFPFKTVIATKTSDWSANGLTVTSIEWRKISSDSYYLTLKPPDFKCHFEVRICTLYSVLYIYSDFRRTW